MSDKVYAFEYCPCIHESSLGVISLHRTKKGAEIAMELHKNEKKKEFDALYDNIEPVSGFGTFEDWRVREIKILE